MSKFEEVRKVLADRYARRQAMEPKHTSPIMDPEQENFYGQIKSQWYKDHPDEELTMEYLETKYRECLVENRSKE